jgi:hypothetical protein
MHNKSARAAAASRGDPAGAARPALTAPVSLPPMSQPELEGNRIVLNATKQAPAPQASKILGRASQPKEAWKWK